MAAVRRLLRPVLRLALSKGLKYQQLDELLKAELLLVCEADGSGGNVSRLSVATGLHRKDVKRLLSEPESAKLSVLPVESQVFTRWFTDPAFANADGAPLTLPRQAEAGQASFESLARAVTTDVHPRAVLESMLRLGVVRETSEGLLQIEAEAFIPKPEQDRMIAWLAGSGHDHLAAAVSNVLGQNRPFLEQSVFGEGFTLESAAALHVLARSEWQRLMGEFAREATRLEKADEGKPGAPQRFRMGMYYYFEDESAGGETLARPAESGA